KDYKMQAITKKQQRQSEIDKFLANNAMGFDIEGAKIVVWSFYKINKGKVDLLYLLSKINISTKDNNIQIFDIQKLNNISTNDIVSTLYSKIGSDFIRTKLYFIRGIQTYLKIIFVNEPKMKQYAKEGINIFQQTFYSYILSGSNQELLLVRLRRDPITDKQTITEEIKEVFENVGISR
ncbi:16844_t:CDS:2, partial [Gigaspora margarita]